MEKDTAVAMYFSIGLTCKEILCALAINHRIVISLRTLKRSLRRQNLFRRKHFSNVLDISLFISEQMKESGNLHGYRWMHMKCQQAGLVTSRNMVYTLMKIIDPEGLDLRKKGRLRRREYFAKGPNYLWHVDSYDKLKPYGLCINGCIDGFSRQLIWMNVYHTSSNPRVIAGYYMEAVSRAMGCPHMVRADMGTENGDMAGMQVFLSKEESFLYGKSMHNQRIESFWCILRKECAQFWMDTLKTLKDEGDFTGSIVDTNLVQFCFMRLVQNDLDAVSSVWNCHRIRINKKENVPHGRPIVMYTMPQVYSTRDYMIAVEPADVEICRDECIFRRDSPCDQDMFELFIIYMAQNSLTPPTNAEEAVELYHVLRSIVVRELITI